MSSIVSESKGWHQVKPGKTFNNRKGSFKKKGSYRKRKTEWNNDTTHFIPKGVKTYVDSVFDKCLGSRDFMKEIKLEIKSN